MGAAYVAEGKVIDYTPGAAVTAGDVVVQGKIVGIAKLDIAASKLGALAVDGIFDIPKKEEIVTVGQQLYWDADGDPYGGTAGDGALTGVAADGVFAGYAVVAAAAAIANARTKLASAPDITPEDDAIADPGDAAAIPVTASGCVALVTEGAETRTLAIPTFIGQKMTIYFKTDGGDGVVTAASAVNQTGNNTLTFADAGDVIALEAIESGAALCWRVVHNDGVGLTTV